jgi:phosphate transport system permease protein
VATGATGAAVRPARTQRDWVRALAWGASLPTAAFALSLLVLCVADSLPVWRHEGVAGYLLGGTWFFRDERFGVLPMIYGTAAVSAIALLLAAPVGIGAAAFTAERLAGRTRLAAKTVIELLAGVPSVVYGLVGILVLRPAMTRLLAPWEPASGDTLATGGVLLAVMILPTVVSVADDAISGVPAAQRRAARALGLTRAEATLRVTLPRALPGLAAAVLLGLGRALGETIALYLVVGRRDNRLPDHLFDLTPLTEAGQTLTTKLGGSETFIAYGDPLHWGAMVGLALVLLVLVVGVTLAGAAALRRRDAPLA